MTVESFRTAQATSFGISFIASSPARLVTPPTTALRDRGYWSRDMAHGGIELADATRGWRDHVMLQLAIVGKLRYSDLRDAVVAHPTLAESLNNLFAQPEW